MWDRGPRSSCYTTSQRMFSGYDTNYSTSQLECENGYRQSVSKWTWLCSCKTKNTIGNSCIRLGDCSLPTSALHYGPQPRLPWESLGSLKKHRTHPIWVKWGSCLKQPSRVISASSYNWEALLSRLFMNKGSQVTHTHTLSHTHTQLTDDPLSPSTSSSSLRSQLPPLHPPCLDQKEWALPHLNSCEIVLQN